MPNSDAERKACYDAAIRAGISPTAIRAFLADNPEDECRINSALAPNAGPGSVVTPLYQIPGLTSYSPAAGSVTGVRADVPIVLPPIQPPGASASPLSTVSANSVVTGPAIPAPRPIAPAADVSPPAVSLALAGVPVTKNGSMSVIDNAPMTAAVGAVMTGAPALAVSNGAAPAPLLAGFGLDNRTLMLVAAAVVVYLLLNR